MLVADFEIGAGTLQFAAVMRRQYGVLAIYKPIIHVLPMPVPVVPVGARRGSVA